MVTDLRILECRSLVRGDPLHPHYSTYRNLLLTIAHSHGIEQHVIIERMSSRIGHAPVRPLVSLDRGADHLSLSTAGLTKFHSLQSFHLES